MALPQWLRILLNLPESTPKESSNPYVVAGRTQAGGATPYFVDPNKGKVWRRILKTLAVLVLGFFLLAGVRAVFSPKKTEVILPETPALAKLSDGAAAGLATRFARIYLTWDEKAPQTRLEALRAFGWTGDVDAGWNGKGVATVRIVDAAKVSVDDHENATVTVVAQQLVRPESGEAATKEDPKNKKPTPTPSPVEQSKAVDVALEIPVLMNSTTMRVGIPRFVAVPSVGTLDQNNLAKPDNKVSEGTKGAAQAFFTAYGTTTDISAITAPGSTVKGVEGLQLVALTKWQVEVLNETDARALAIVVWRRDATELTQTYRLNLKKSTAGDQSRWQVASIA